MKSLLWLVISLSVIFNVASGFLFDGVLQIVVNVASGLLLISAAVALFLTRSRTRQA